MGARLDEQWCGTVRADKQSAFGIASLGERQGKVGVDWWGYTSAFSTSVRITGSWHMHCKPRPGQIMCRLRRETRDGERERRTWVPGATPTTMTTTTTTTTAPCFPTAWNGCASLLESSNDLSRIHGGREGRSSGTELRLRAKAGPTSSDRAFAQEDPQ